ncbi:MAG: hypothetical protein C0502_00335 [Opitutus sp.]|nr:hypothetical protein [Opitutus sp.]
MPTPRTPTPSAIPGPSRAGRPPPEFHIFVEPPLVSIVIPTKDRIALLRETIGSVCAQTHRHWEAIVVDDGSTGQATQHVELPSVDARIVSVRRADHRPESGAQVCRNVGTVLARGEFVLYLDSDDLLAPDCLRRRVAALLEHPELDFVVGQCTQFGHSPKDDDPLWAEWNPGQDDLDAFLGLGKIPWQTTGPLWRKAALARVGPWDESLVHAGHDHELHVRALCRGLAYAKLPGTDYHWRRPRGDSLSSLEGFKAHHARGSMIAAFRAILTAVVGNGKMTPVRRSALRREAVKLAVLCRLHGGAADTAAEAIRAARGQGLLLAWEAREILLALACWRLRLAGRIPAMAYLNRRHRFAA